MASFPFAGFASRPWDKDLQHLVETTSRLLGDEKYYIFTNTTKKDRDDHLKWMMHEYSVEGSKNLVFCEIKYELVGNKKRKSSSSTVDHANDEGPSSTVKKICLGPQNSHQLANQESVQENQNPVPIMVINTHSHENRDDFVPLNFNDHGVMEDLPDANYLPLMATNTVTYDLNPTSPNQILDDSFFFELEQLWDWKNNIENQASLVC
ncbi:hypothetical protein COLO4_28878 [Corchorus olitorius]|uniref:No apical meristem (NAM) protein n=1 Tax=Corchorus olitorius TaxID=93759 RepID=A0A1R3HHV8_9ROSI|nr:hypothetical protein COLO4_28878 [Corchorus olitorius]